MAQTLKLCVSCKACRRECPTGVDMARMKIEVQAARVAKHGLSLRDRLVGYLPRYAPLAARWPDLANLRDDKPRLKQWSEKYAGLSARRSLPRWRSDVWREPTRLPGADNARGAVFFADTFNRYFEPENIEAALGVLTAAGYAVHLPKPVDGGRRPLCCGRTFLAVGLVDEARREAQRCVAALSPLVARGLPVVGLEPSCVLGFRDELPALVNSDEARRLAANALLFEEFLAREAEAGTLDLPLKPVAKRALLHGHCHQKSFGAMGAAETVLGLVPDLAVETVEFELLRHGRRLRLRRRHHRRVAQDGGALIAAGGAQGRARYAGGGRRHLVPASDQGRQRARRAPRRARAGDEPQSVRRRHRHAGRHGTRLGADLGA